MDEATILARRILGLPFTYLEQLDNTVKRFFDRGPAVTSKKFAALQSAVLDGETVVDLGFVFTIPLYGKTDSLEFLQACHHPCSSTCLFSGTLVYA